MAAELHPNVVIMGLGWLDGFETTRRIVEAEPDTQVWFVSLLDDAAHRAEAARSGAKRYLNLGTPPAEIVRTLRDFAKEATATPQGSGSPALGSVAGPVSSAASAHRKHPAIAAGGSPYLCLYISPDGRTLPVSSGLLRAREQLLAVGFAQALIFSFYPGGPFRIDVALAAPVTPAQSRALLKIAERQADRIRFGVDVVNTNDRNGSVVWSQSGFFTSRRAVADALHAASSVASRGDAR
jgi:CheY-like chemotaxis protein